MQEAKANEEKVGSFEVPPKWMIEFLMKMKQEIKDELMEELLNLPHVEVQRPSSSDKGDEYMPQSEVIHPGIFCDNCDQLIHGIRYKCGNCSDFDLCQECENLPNSHNKNHVFLKIRYPVALKLYRQQKGSSLIPNPCDILVSNSRLKHKLERLESKIANRQSKGLYAARFLWDETIPDGTVLPPSTMFVKSWRVVNCGKKEWNHHTKLQHVQGSGLIPDSELVDVPHLKPGEEGVVSIIFTTPSTPGVYTSHWNFCFKGRTFGHIVWCHIIVKDIDPEKVAENVCQTVQLPPDGLPDEKKQEVASIAQVLTAVKEEHERGIIIPRKLAVNSHTATPNNTPFDLTPPKSPDHQAMNELKEVSEEKESVVSSHNPDLDQDDDGSVMSLSSSESDAEFVVIPMPKCFNLSESFSSHNIPHLKQFLQSDSVNDLKDLKSEPKPVKPQNILIKPAFNAETVSQETGVPELSALSEAQKETEQKIVISHNVSPDGSSSSEISIIESGDSSPTADHVVPEISSIHIAVTSDSTPKTEIVDEGGNRREEESSVDAQYSSVTFPKFPVEGITSIYEPASSNTEEKTVQVLPERLVTASMNAAANLFKTARGVISSFQPATTVPRSSENATSANPIDQLAEMGFCNRQQNEELLKKHNNDVALVVAELVNLNDNDWYASRHVPPSPPDYFN